MFFPALYVAKRHTIIKYLVGINNFTGVKFLSTSCSGKYSDYSTVEYLQCLKKSLSFHSIFLMD